MQSYLRLLIYAHGQEARTVSVGRDRRTGWHGSSRDAARSVAAGSVGMETARDSKGLGPRTTRRAPAGVQAVKYQIDSRWYRWREELQDVPWEQLWEGDDLFPPHDQWYGINVLCRQETRRPLEYTEAMEELALCRDTDMESGMGLGEYWLQPV